MKIALFDMDGTLTPARGQMTSDVLSALTSLQKAGWAIGIVSGSDIDYIVDQCDILFDINNFDFLSVLWFPCNGTKQYKFLPNGSRSLIYSNDMKSTIGVEKYNQLIKNLFDAQIAIRYSLGGREIPMSGTFFQYRGTMVNWCPIGRDASFEDRQAWVNIDKKHNIRNSALERLRCLPVVENLTVKLGGDTSFDIYPTGWDKTYALSALTGYDQIVFVGDRCGENGNDREIFEAVQRLPSGQAYQTNGPADTVEIIKKFL